MRVEVEQMLDGCILCMCVHVSVDNICSVTLHDQLLWEKNLLIILVVSIQFHSLQSAFGPIIFLISHFNKEVFIKF